MAIRDEVLKKLLEGYKNPEDLLGPEGLLKQLTAALVRRAPHRYHPPETVRPPLRRLAGALVGGYCTKGHLTTSSRGACNSSTSATSSPSGPSTRGRCFSVSTCGWRTWRWSGPSRSPDRKSTRLNS